MTRSITALVACCLALPFALDAAPARPSVLSFWNAVFPERKIVPAGSGWRMVGGPAWPDGPTIAGKGNILVDAANGFLSCSFAADPLEYAVTAALFTTRGDAAFLLTAYAVDGPEGSSSSLQAHRWQSGRISEVSNLMPRITLADFVDETWLASHPNDRKAVLSAGRLVRDFMAHPVKSPRRLQARG